MQLLSLIPRVRRARGPVVVAQVLDDAPAAQVRPPRPAWRTDLAHLRAVNAMHAAAARLPRQRVPEADLRPGQHEGPVLAGTDPSTTSNL